MEVSLLKNRLFKCCFRYIGLFVLSIGLSYILAAIMVKGSSIIGNAIDLLFLNGHVELTSFLTQMIFMIALGFAAAFINSTALSKFSILVQTTYKELVAKKIYRLEYQYFDENGSATMINKMNDDIAGVDALLTENLPELCTNIISTVTYAVYIGQLKISLLFVILLCYPSVMLISKVITKKIVSLRKVHREKADRITEVAQDSMSGILVLRTFAAEDIFQKKLDQAADDLVSNEEKRAKISNASIIIRQMLQWLPNIICAVYAYILVRHGQISLGNLMSFLIILTAFVHALVGLPFIFIDIKENAVCVARIEAILNASEESGGTIQHADACEEAIRFDQVEFGYSKDVTVLNRLSFCIRTGESIAFVGDSGGGKSTIFRLLCGFYPLNAGNYFLFHHPFSQWDIDAARDQFALVSQNVFLFPGSIYENVAYGRQDASHEDVIRACKLARIHDFIVSLPNQYESVVGERGILLSGGEKQRISIARAILKNAPILLLDEPTSAVDVATEHLIQEAIDNLSKNRTCITIAHRLSTIENVDRIMVLKDGQIVEQGCHAELIARKGVYYHMYGKEVTT